MYDPLQAAAVSSSSNNNKANGSGQTPSSPPATPSKSRIMARPAPYKRPASSSVPPDHPQFEPPQQQQQQQQAYQQASPTSSLPHHSHSHHRALNQGMRSQSPMAPRPPLPGQAARPVSPLGTLPQQYQQSTSSPIVHSHPSYLSPPAGSGFAQHGEPDPAAVWGNSPGGGPSSSMARSLSPTSPNAWAGTSPTRHTDGDAAASSSSFVSASATLPSARYHPPGPVPLPPPVNFGSPQPARTTPGLPRSPIAEQTHRSILSQQARTDDEDEGGDPSHTRRSQHMQQPKELPPPFIRLRIQGIDRAKKELGIKMDCQTNIPTYHRHHTSVFSRTYAEFAALHSALSANHPEVILAALPLPQTSATSEEEEDRFLRIIFQRFVDRITNDRALILDDELRAFVESDFGYSPMTRAKKLKSSSGFLSRSTSRATASEDGEPDFLVTAKVHSAALETALQESNKVLDRSLKANAAAAAAFAELSTVWHTYATTESHAPLAEGIKRLADASRAVAELEVGQCNATALVLQDALAYEAVEARSAKDALLQRQYNIDELRSSMKNTIGKKRAIEKLRNSNAMAAGGGVKTEKVTEALEELDEAVKLEKTLTLKVERISMNLRPSLQNHLKTLNKDILHTMILNAKNQLAYENRKLEIYAAVNRRVKGISTERAAAADGIYRHHQAVRVGTSASSGEQQIPSSVSASTAVDAGARHSISVPTPSDAEARTANVRTSPISQSKFLATQVQIKAAMEAQQAAAEAARTQGSQHTQGNTATHPKPGRGGLHTLSSHSSEVSASVHQQALPAQQNLKSHADSGSAADGLSTAPVMSGGRRTGSETQHTTSPANLSSRSMFLPPGPNNPAARLPPPASPLRNPSHPAEAPQISPQKSFPTSQNATSDPLVAYTGAESGGHNHNGVHRAGSSVAESPALPVPGSDAMSQSMWLPGRSANATRSNPAEDRKRADARKAASLLAGAF